MKDDDGHDCDPVCFPASSLFDCRYFFHFIYSSPLAGLKIFDGEKQNAFLKPMMKSVTDLLSLDCKSFVIEGFTRFLL